jgi:glycosyltransferase involved in cell wall biosynthesis
MKCDILTFNNYAGILTDASMLYDIIKEITPNVDITFLDTIDFNHKSDIAIWIQNYYPNMLDNFKINIFFINEEWFDYPVDDLKKFDYVVCKSIHTFNLLKLHCNCVCLPFVSRDYYRSDIQKTHKFLNFMGRSIQKNTELVLKQELPITLIDPSNRYSPEINIYHINTYQSTNQIVSLLNSHSTHICISLYESWGHYLFEGLSTGAEIICSDIPVFKEQLDNSLIHMLPTTKTTNLQYLFDNNNISNLYPMRQSFYVNPNEFKNKLLTFEPIGKNKQRREMYLDIMSRNKTNLFNFFHQLF